MHETTFDSASNALAMSAADRAWRSLRSHRFVQWRGQVNEMIQRQHDLQEQGRWFAGPGSILAILGRSRRETFHCRILAWLLDPMAPHGLKAQLLDWLVREELNQDISDDLRLASTRCEEVRSNSRADLVVRLPSLTIVCEAKVDHIERERQCLDLYNDWAEDGRVCFVFLTPTGRRPQTAGEAAEEFKTWSFARIASKLRRLAGSLGDLECPHPAGRAAVLDYLSTLESEFEVTRYADVE